MKTRYASLALVAASLVSIGCESGSAPVSESPTKVEPATASEPAPPETPAEAKDDETAPFVLHEWGLVHFEGAIPVVGTSGHGMVVRDRKMKPKKPLVYITPDEGFDFSTAIDVRVTLASGTLREVWPNDLTKWSQDHRAFEWEGITLSKEKPCGRELAPSLRSAECRALEQGVCEAAELSRYLQPVPHCMGVGGQDAPVLVYNGTLDTSTFPVSHDERMITNDSPNPVGPVYLRKGGSIHRVDTIEGSASVAWKDAKDLGADHAAFVERVRADLVAQGLTETQATDFIEAWRPDVLAESGGSPVFGFYSRAGIDAISTLEIRPAPREVHRVMAFAVR